MIFSISIKRKKNQSQRKKNQDTHNKVRNKDSGYLNNKVNNPQYLINCIHFFISFLLMCVLYHILICISIWKLKLFSLGHGSFEWVAG